MNRTIVLLPLAAALMLAACGRNTPDEAPMENDAAPAPVEPLPSAEEDVPPPPPPAAPVENSANAAAAQAPAPPPQISAEQQMLDDAEASGFTARLPIDGNGAAPPSEGQSAQ